MKLSDKLKNVIQIADNEIQQETETNEKFTNIFVIYVDQLVYFPIQKEGLPSEMMMKQIKDGSNQNIDVFFSCHERIDILSHEWSNIVLKAIRVNTFLKGPNIILEISRNFPAHI